MSARRAASTAAASYGLPVRDSSRAFQNAGKKGKEHKKPARAEQTKGTFVMLDQSRLKSPLLSQTPPIAPPPLPIFHSACLDPAFQSKVTKMSKSSLLDVYGLPINLLLDFRFFPEPTTLIRDFTPKLLKRMNEAAASPSSASRIVLTGDSGSGRSYALLQVTQYCNANGWIVLYIPRAKRLVDGSSSFVYDSRTRTYLQNDIAFQILTRLLAAAADKLVKLAISAEIASKYRHLKIQNGADLTTVIKAGINDRPSLMDYTQLVFDVLDQQKNFPVLLAIDDMQAIFQPSKYISAQSTPIDSYHLSVPRLLLEYSNAHRVFARGALIGAISNDDKRFDVPLELLESLGPQTNSVWERRSIEYMKYAEGLKAFAIPPRLSIEEAANLFELWKHFGVVNAESTDEFFLSKYTESCGNPKDFIWKGILATLQA